MKGKNTVSELIARVKGEPSLLWVSLASFFVMGLGQLINKQRAKALLFFLIPLVFFGFEFFTSRWTGMEKGYQDDYIQYFGETLSGALEDQSNAMSEASQRTVLVDSPEVSRVDASLLLEGMEDGYVFVKIGVGEDDEIGYLVPTYLAQGFLVPQDAEYFDPETVSLDEKNVEIFSPIFSAMAQATVQVLSASQAQGALAPARVAFESPESLGLPEGSLIRVSYHLYVNDNDLGYFHAYYSDDFARTVVGPLPKSDEKLYPIRDYGGYISRGVWGMLSLGSLVIGDVYRGQEIEAFNPDKPWASADNSSLLLARGMIASLFILIFVFFWALNVVDAWHSRDSFLRTGTTMDIKAYAKDVWDRAYVWFLIAPAALLILFFTLVPFIFTFLCGFTNWTYRVYLLQQLIKWTGFKEYVSVFLEPAWLQVFMRVLSWTVVYALLSSISVYAMGFAHALVIESPLIKAKKFWRTIVIIPWAMPSLISLLAFRNIFHKDGLANQILLATNLMQPVSKFLHAIGLAGQADPIIFWFDPPYNANLAKAVILLVNLWLGAPYFMMLITGILSTISQDRFEAAMIDGANALQRFWHITLPLVLTATIPAMIMTVTFNFNNFGAIYFLTGGGPLLELSKLPDELRTWTNSMPAQTDILISWIYKISFNQTSQLYNKASVYSVFVFLILGLFSVVNMKLSKTFDEKAGE